MTNLFPSAWIDFVTANAGALIGFSIATLIMTFVLLPVMIVRLPTDYFSKATGRGRYRGICSCIWCSWR